ncbi:amidase [Spirochaetia bacterium]|nr:amidase [Spirochaetia bacterium]
MVTVTDNIIRLNSYSRSGAPMKEVLAIVVHWTAAPMQRAIHTRNYFNTMSSQYGSAHYIVDLDGSIIRCIPENEVAWHCGSSLQDPASGKIYTDMARYYFPQYVTGNTSPNFCSIGIEMCCTDSDGSIEQRTLDSCMLLCKELVAKYPQAVMITHNEIVGWKDCPRLFVRQPNVYKSFIKRVRN